MRTKWISTVLATCAALIGAGTALRVVHGSAPLMLAAALIAVAIASWPSKQVRIRLPNRDSR